MYIKAKHLCPNFQHCLFFYLKWFIKTTNDIKKTDKVFSLTLVQTKIELKTITLITKHYVHTMKTEAETIYKSANMGLKTTL
jgi:hypothetical protein